MNTFRYRILLVDDDPVLRALGEQMLALKDYEVLGVSDGFEGLAALRRSLPDVIISDLEMPNMNGFEFLSVIRRRFPIIPVIVISGAFHGVSIPENVLADAFFPKAGYKTAELFDKICELVHELPTRPRIGKSDRAAVWVKRDKGAILVSCPECLRTFPVLDMTSGENEVRCTFCHSPVHFEIIREERVSELEPSYSS